jgi:hypothetical protein
LAVFIHLYRLVAAGCRDLAESRLPETCQPRTHLDISHWPERRSVDTRLPVDNSSNPPARPREVDTGLMQLSSVVLTDLWGIHSAVERTTLGVSRTTWRVAKGFWLSRCGNERGEAFRRECNFLQALAETAKANPRLMLIVPSLIPTKSGDVVSVHSGFLWRLTRHIDGLHPSPNDPVTYDLMLNVVLRLHKAFDSASNQCPTCPDIVGRVRESLIAAAQYHFAILIHTQRERHSA